MTGIVRKQRPRRAAARAGQAIIEFVVGLVAVLAVAAGLLQIARLARAHTETLALAREEAARDAMSAGYVEPVSPAPRFIRDWSLGPDGAAYSRDDRIVPGSPGDISSLLIERARPDDLEDLLPDNPVSPMSDPAAVMPGFYLVRGGARSDPIPLLPVVRRLLYNAPSITMEGEVYLIWTTGIY